MNSVARIANPKGIKINAGPGSANIKIPMIRMVNPMTELIVLLMDFKFGFI
jgi:hypothetical protein